MQYAAIRIAELLKILTVKYERAHGGPFLILKQKLHFNMAMALDNLRVGRVYRLVNLGEERFIEIMARLSGENFKVKDLATLEIYEMEELLRWGIGKDYDLDEVR